MKRYYDQFGQHTRPDTKMSDDMDLISGCITLFAVGLYYAFPWLVVVGAIIAILI